MEVRTRRPVDEQPPGLFTEHLMTMIWTLTPSQNQTCRYYPDHSCTGWMIECERCRTTPRKMQHKTTTNILQYGECLYLQHEKHLYSWWRMTWKFYIPSKVQEKISQWNRCLTFLKFWIAEQSDEIYGVNTINWCIFRFCVMPWKDEREPTNKCCLGGQVDVVQKFTTIQSFGHNWWWTNGIREQYFPGFTTLRLCYKVQDLMPKMSKEPEDFTGGITFMSMFNDISWRSKENRNAN